MNSPAIELCGKTIVLGPHASRSDVCGKPAGHDDNPDNERLMPDLVHRGDRRGVEWYVDSDGTALCGDRRRILLRPGAALPEARRPEGRIEDGEYR